MQGVEKTVPKVDERVADVLDEQYQMHGIRRAHLKLGQQMFVEVKGSLRLDLGFQTSYFAVKASFAWEKTLARIKRSYAFFMSYDSIDIKCPTCGKLANFEEPFLFSDPKNIPNDIEYKSWGGWGIVEKFPSDFQWIAPSGSSQFIRGGGDNGTSGYPLLTFGLIQCSNCHANIKHKLNWPSDSFWQWEIRGELLWAWDYEHAKVILEYIQSDIRPSRKCYSLKYIPTHFLSSKVKQEVTKKMVRSINA